MACLLWIVHLHTSQPVSPRLEAYTTCLGSLGSGRVGGLTCVEAVWVPTRGVPSGTEGRGFLLEPSFPLGRPAWACAACSSPVGACAGSRLAGACGVREADGCRAGCFPCERNERSLRSLRSEGGPCAARSEGGPRVGRSEGGPRVGGAGLRRVEGDASRRSAAVAGACADGDGECGRLPDAGCLRQDGSRPCSGDCC